MDPAAASVVRASGRDAVTYLQGQLSQDVAALAVGASSPSFLLEPQGKVVAWLRVTRTGDQEIVLDVEAGFVEAVLDRLERFKLRTKCTFEPLDWRVVAVRGPADPPARRARGAGGWPGVDGFDVLGPAAGTSAPDGIPEGDPEAFEALRIESGVPRMGAEITEKTIPAELGRWVVDASVSFTKGCYTGQELVSRIDSRGGNVPRRLHGIVFDGADRLPAPGGEVEVDGRPVGRLTSVARSAELDAPVALAFVHRSVEPPAEADVDGAPGRIEALPLVGR